MSPQLATWLWVGWAAYFGVVEGYAIYKHQVDRTLSWQVWREERKSPLIKWAVAGGLLWLILHFFNG